MEAAFPCPSCTDLRQAFVWDEIAVLDEPALAHLQLCNLTWWSKKRLNGSVQDGAERVFRLPSWLI